MNTRAPVGASSNIRTENQDRVKALAEGFAKRIRRESKLVHVRGALTAFLDEKLKAWNSFKDRREKRERLLRRHGRKKPRVKEPKAGYVTVNNFMLRTATDATLTHGYLEIEDTEEDDPNFNYVYPFRKRKLSSRDKLIVLIAIHDSVMCGEDYSSATSRITPWNPSDLSTDRVRRLWWFNQLELIRGLAAAENDLVTIEGWKYRDLKFPAEKEGYFRSLSGSVELRGRIAIVHGESHSLTPAQADVVRTLLKASVSNEPRVLMGVLCKEHPGALNLLRKLAKASPGWAAAISFPSKSQGYAIP